MHVKWIVCQVKKNCKSEFSSSQEQWIVSQYQSGFLGQVGGWNVKKENEACVISFWQNQLSYKNFMLELHDQVFYSNRQNETYENIEVQHFETILDMKGKDKNFIQSIKDGEYLRIADCTVKLDKIKHFIKIQNEVWLPGMGKADGMLGGTFSRSIDNNNRFLVSTLWNSKEHHEEYVSKKLSELKSKANVKEDIDSMEGKLIALEPGWKMPYTF
jgi:heme-degrading monooxygenase HmoA